MKDYARKLNAAKRSSTAHLLIKCARLINERAIASFSLPAGERPSASHLGLFSHIELEGGTRVTDLARRIGVTKQAVGQLVDDLERFGLVSRESDPDDGRAKRVCFTVAGKESMLTGLAHLKQVETPLKRALGRDTMRSLHQGLLELHDHLETLPTTADEVE